MTTKLEGNSFSRYMHVQLMILCPLYYVPTARFPVWRDHASMPINVLEPFLTSVTEQRNISGDASEIICYILGDV